jgi:low temperature requirement protein LtrA
MLTRKYFWQKPSLHHGEESNKERKVSWLELFYDLFFVALIAQLSHKLHGHFNIHHLFEFIILFIPMAWVWIGSAYYQERFETHGIETRFFYFLKMVPLAGMAIFASQGLEKGAAGFALSYAAARLVITLLWLRAGIIVKEFRKIAIIFSLGFSSSIILFTVSAFSSPSIRILLWTIALAFDLITPLTTGKLQAKLPQLGHHKFPERFGLFFMIFLGEAIIGVVSGIAHLHHLTATLFLRGLLGIGLIFGLWSLYYDFIARRFPKPKMIFNFMWVYGHLPLFMSITVLGAAISNTIAGKGDLWLLSGAYGLVIFSLGIIELTLMHTSTEPTHAIISPGLKLCSGAIGLAVAFFGLIDNVNWLFLFLFILLFIQMAYGAFVFLSVSE